MAAEGVKHKKVAAEGVEQRKGGRRRGIRAEKRWLRQRWSGRQIQKERQRKEKEKGDSCSRGAGGREEIFSGKSSIAKERQKKRGRRV